MKAKHTIGPWRQGELLQTRAVKSMEKYRRRELAREERNRVFSNFHNSDEGRTRALVCTVNQDHPNSGVNMKLIAAAPEMLEALIDVKEMYSDLKGVVDESTLRVINNIGKIIEKATQ